MLFNPLKRKSRRTLKNLNKIEEIIGYAFKDKTLLERAFIHSSYANERGEQSYERLEFLGDGVLGMIVAEKLYGTESNEGDMTEKRARIVSSAPLENATQVLGIGQYIKFGAGESKQSHTRRKVLADLYEAITGAIYLDGGYEEARSFVFRTLGNLIEETIKRPFDGNSKGELQEYCQAKKLGAIDYPLISRGGKPHEPSFTVGVTVGGKKYAEGKGCRIKDAEREAAKIALEILRRNAE